MEAENSQPRFAVCINNTAYPDDLKMRTIYQVLPDDSAARRESFHASSLSLKVNQQMDKDHDPEMLEEYDFSGGVLGK